MFFQESLLLLKDPNRCLYPLIRDNVGGIQNPTWSNLSPVSCLAIGRNKTSDDGKSQLIVTVLVVEDSELIQSIMRSDDESMLQYLKYIAGDQGTFLECQLLAYW